MCVFGLGVRKVAERKNKKGNSKNTSRDENKIWLLATEIWFSWSTQNLVPCPSLPMFDFIPLTKNHFLVCTFPSPLFFIHTCMAKSKLQIQLSPCSVHTPGQIKVVIITNCVDYSHIKFMTLHLKWPLVLPGNQGNKLFSPHTLEIILDFPLKFLTPCRSPPFS